MAIEKVIVDQFKTAKPQFANVPDDTIQTYLDLAELWVDGSWPEKLYKPAMIAAACHLMTLDGLGTDAYSQSQKDGTALFSTIRSGQLSLTRYRQSSGDNSDYQSWLSQTPCGQFFLQLLRRVKAGPRVVTVSGMGCASPYAKDQHCGSYGWPGVFLGNK